jgi:sugar O-acyltransferase (sialic acid O-acetyltransferase NeuD family)
MKEGIIIGYSGHAFVVMEVLLACGYSIASYCEKEKKEFNPYNLKYLGNECNLSSKKYFSNKPVFIGIGDNQARAKVYFELFSNGVATPSARHPSAIISPNVNVGDASILMPGSLINPFVSIGKAVICNTGCIIEHQCIIGDFSHIAPGAVLAGNVKVGRNCFIGANAVIKQGVEIGDNVVVGAGSVVLKNLQNGSLCYGNPAKNISHE